MYSGIHHVSLLVTDMNTSMHFYESVLGFEQNKKRPSFDFPGVWYDIGDTQIHLLVHPKGKARRNTTEIDSRDGHFAIRVTDMDKLLKTLDTHKISYVNKPNNKTDWHQVFVSDPDGNIIEFNA